MFKISFEEEKKHPNQRTLEQMKYENYVKE